MSGSARDASDGYRRLVRHAVLAVSGADRGRWAQVADGDPAGQLVVREAVSDLWEGPEAPKGNGLSLLVLHVQQVRGPSPTLDVDCLAEQFVRVGIGNQILLVSRTSEVFTARPDDGLWGRFVPHTVYVAGPFSVLWFTRGTRPGSGRPALVVLGHPPADTLPARPSRRVVRKEKP